VVSTNLPNYDPQHPVFPCLCDLCGYAIENDDDDLMWHGYGNCADLPPEMLEEIQSFAEALGADNPLDGLAKIQGLERKPEESDENLQLRIKQIKEQ
jgi:hypothetical protein